MLQNSVRIYATKFSNALCYKIQQGIMFNFELKHFLENTKKLLQL